MIGRKRCLNTALHPFAAGILACGFALGACGGSAAPEESLQQAAGLASPEPLRASSLAAAPAQVLDMKKAPAPRRATAQEVEAHLAQIRASREANLRNTNPENLDHALVNAPEVTKTDIERKAP